jgi:hypothetical protein
MAALRLINPAELMEFGIAEGPCSAPHGPPTYNSP